ncbi:MAG TPA: hypothetical protein VFN61_04520 [Acidimicrobiales bacterium]|nr:hypothetical protein [Acidimicrobiales bacterium]
MSVGGGQVAAGVLLIVAGVWLVTQTLIGGLPARLVGLSSSSKASSSAPGLLTGPPGVMQD